MGKKLDIKDPRFGLVKSTIKGCKEVEIVFNYKGEDHKYFIFVDEGKNVNYINEAKKQFEKDVKSGKVLKIIKGNFVNHRPWLIAGASVLGVAAITFAALFTWKALSTSGGSNNHVKINFTTEGCKVYKNDKNITSDDAIKDACQTYTIKLNDEYKQDYDLSEYSLKVYTLDGEEYDPTRYTFNYKAGILSINPGEEVNVKCRATLAVTKFTYVYSDSDYEVTLHIQGVFDYIDWGDGNRSEYNATGIYTHEYDEVAEGTEYTIRIVGNAFNFNSINPSGYGPSWLKEAYFSHHIINISTNIMGQGNTLCPVENVYIEDGLEQVSALSMRIAGANYNTIKSVRLPETAKTMSGTFRNAQSLNEISIPDSVTTLGNGLLSDSQIKKVNFTTKSKLMYILNGTFGNSIIESLALPKNVSHINDQAFNNCTSLETLDLSLLNSVPHLGDIVGTEETEMLNNVFDKCTSLEKIIVPKGMRQAYLDNESWQVQKLSSSGTAGEVLDLIVEAE